MVTIRYLACACLIAFGSAPAIAQDFPEHPANMTQAEAQGLARAGISELKAFMPGTIQMQGNKGTSKTKTFKPDGTLETDYPWDKGGTWKFDNKHDGYCNSIAKESGIAKNCFFVFKAADGAHYFDYDVKNGFYSAVWRPAPKQ